MNREKRTRTKLLRILISILGVIFLTFIVPSTQSILAAEDEVAKITIFSDGSGPAYGTHAFIYIVNISDDDIKIGDYTLKPNKGVTIGTFGNKDDGKGIYYNLEAYFIQEYDSYENRVSLTTKITAKDIETINSKLDSCNKWTYTKNCSWFATSIWNSVSPKKKHVSAGLVSTPATLSKNIKKIKGYVEGKKVKKVSEDNVYRYKNDGKKTKASSSSKKGSPSGLSNSSSS
ncbi:MAG: hypothetical protein HFJ09_03715 [Lachnospiraceae bacterium]|nr:hypothetical protein [Lachnospiraceae bacterium]